MCGSWKACQKWCHTLTVHFGVSPCWAKCFFKGHIWSHFQVPTILGVVSKLFTSYNFQKTWEILSIAAAPLLVPVLANSIGQLSQAWAGNAHLVSASALPLFLQPWPFLGMVKDGNCNRPVPTFWQLRHCKCKVVGGLSILILLQHFCSTLTLFE